MVNHKNRMSKNIAGKGIEFGPETPNYAVLNEALRKQKSKPKGVVAKPVTGKAASHRDDKNPS